MVCVCDRTCASIGCLECPILPSGAPRAKPRSGPPARSRAPTWRTEGPQSTTLSMPTRWRLACTRSWPSGASGWERHRPSACRGHLVRDRARTCPGWAKNPRALAGHLRRRRQLCGPWALRFCSVAKVERGRVIIRMSNPLKTTVSTVSSVRNNGSHQGSEPDVPVGAG
jgi:hypothetical protein